MCTVRIEFKFKKRERERERKKKPRQILRLDFLESFELVLKQSSLVYAVIFLWTNEYSRSH